MEDNKHHIKVFQTEDSNTNIICCDGADVFVCNSIEQLKGFIGNDIYGEMQNAEEDNSIGFRIDYTITPIKENPFA